MSWSARQRLKFEVQQSHIIPLKRTHWPSRIRYPYGYEGTICYLYSRWLLRFEFQLPHPILSPALATDKKWPLSQFHISYQNSEISWPKVLISDFQSQSSMSKIIRNFIKKLFIEEYHFRGTFLLLTFFENFNL